MFIEALAAALVFFVAFTIPQLGNIRLRRLRRGFNSLARRRVAAIALVAILTFVTSALISLIVQIPVPAQHDEFAYLLGADTFVHGRLSNPTHPLWEHFETFHVIQHPTYQMKYPPAQAVALALGQLVWEPILGVWLSFALGCGAVTWMLYGVLPPRWALLGGLLAAFHSNILLAWTQLYWGGAVPMLGGALLFGALFRILKAPRPVDGIVLGLGLAVLANSRPYEGLVASIPAAIVLAVWLFRCNEQTPILGRLTRVVLPVTAILFVAAIAMGQYNRAVTGDPFTMPYQVWHRTHGTGESVVARIVSSSGRGEVESSAGHASVIPRQIELEQWTLDQPKAAILKLARQWDFFIGPILIVPLLVALPACRRGGIPLFALITVALVMVAVAVEATPGLPHYLAPIVCLLYYLVVSGIRRIRLWKPTEVRTGRVLCWGFVLMSFACLAPAAFSWKRVQGNDQLFGTVRERLLRQLEQIDGRHLVIVRYPEKYNYRFEWVYNGADIDSSRIVWARELNATKVRRLTEYFADRTHWLIDSERIPAQLVEYPEKKSHTAISRQPVSRQLSQTPLADRKEAQ